jgi:hypothetical protein
VRRLAAFVPAVLLAAACGSTSAHVSAKAPPTTPVAGAPHIDPYKASLAFARCMRAHGVVHPNPDRNGDFHLTPKQERAMRASATPAQHEAAEKACFHLLKGVFSTKPLSKGAMRAALEPLRELKRCLESHGVSVGKPTVRNLSRGRAMFGFDSAGNQPAKPAIQHLCEKKVKLAQRIDAIVKADRGEGQ